MAPRVTTEVLTIEVVVVAGEVAEEATTMAILMIGRSVATTIRRMDSTTDVTAGTIVIVDVAEALAEDEVEVGIVTVERMDELLKRSPSMIARSAVLRFTPVAKAPRSSRRR